MKGIRIRPLDIVRETNRDIVVNKNENSNKDTSQVEFKNTYDLRIGGIEDVIAWGWDGIKLLDEFIKIDYETLEGLDEESEGYSKQWAPIFMFHPDTWRMLITQNNNIAGYWHFAPLFDEDYLLAGEGKLLESQITIDRVQNFELPGNYKIYFCQICLLPQFRTTKYIRMLFESVIDVFENLADNDIFITHVCANAYTPSGLSLCKTFNLAYCCHHYHSGEIYSCSISKLLESPFAMRKTSLRKKYKRKKLLK